MTCTNDDTINSFPRTRSREGSCATFSSRLGIAIALGIGVAGYHLIARLGWIDSLLNASMILGGMGPVNELRTPEAKLFASAYALFSGLVFVALSGLLLAPFLHRLVHRFHLDEER